MSNKGNKTDFTFTYKQNSKTKEYLREFDKIKWNKEIANEQQSIRRHSHGNIGIGR